MIIIKIKPFGKKLLVKPKKLTLINEFDILSRNCRVNSAVSLPQVRLTVLSEQSMYSLKELYRKSFD